MLPQVLHSFLDELEKIAAPRWLQAFKNNPEAFLRSVAPEVGSQWGQVAKRLGGPDVKRGRIAAALGFQRPAHQLHDLSMSDPLRRATYFRVGDQAYKLTGSIEKEIAPEFQNMAAKGIKDLATRTKEYVAGIHPEDARHIGKHRALNSPRMIEVEHYTRNPKDLLAGNVRTPSAATHGAPVQTVFTFPKGSPDAELFAPTAERTAEGVQRVVSRVPERAVTYAPSSIRAGAGMSPEILVPGGVFQKGVM